MTAPNPLEGASYWTGALEDRWRPSPAGAVRTEVVPAGELLTVIHGVEWEFTSVLLDPTWLVRPSAATTWDTSAVVAYLDGRAAGVLALQRPRNEVAARAVFDPESVAAVLTALRADPTEYLLLGGGASMVSGTATRAGLNGMTSETVRRALVRRGHQEARRRDLVPVASYVRGPEMPAFTASGTRSAIRSATLATMAVPPTFEEYLASLGSRKRSTVRRDLAAMGSGPLVSEVVPAADAVGAAGTLVAAVNTRHGVADHPRVAALRLAEWARQPVGRRLAFTVSVGAELMAVVFGCHVGHTLELHEAGLADSPHRHVAYVESVVYAPLRYAIANDVEQLQLGLSAETPKRLRGARIEPVWAVG